MILRRDKYQSRILENCHEGKGRLWFTELLADYNKPDAGFMFVHDNVIEPGASIGEHAHQGDEEVYIILTGSGVMKVDGVDEPVRAGDICITRGGHSHSLTNSLEGPMHFLVIAAKT